MPPDELMSQDPVSEPLPKRSPVNFFFVITAGLVGLFVVTIFSMIATLFGDPQAPVNKLLDQHALTLIGIETCGILVCGALAMTVDQHTNSRHRDSQHTVEQSATTAVNTTAEPE